MADPKGPRPPRLLAALARLLLRGSHAPFVRRDLDESFARDLAGGRPRGRATRRYAANLLGSSWSLGRGGLRHLFMRGTLLDAKLGMRMLLKQPMLTGVAMLALGLGIPSALVLQHGMQVMLRPFPVPDGERVMGIRYWDMGNRTASPATLHDLETWTGALTSFESLAAVRPATVNLQPVNRGPRP